MLLTNLTVNEMKNIICYPHGGSGNRGCEAIVRGTKNILNDYQLVLFSSSINQDKEVELNTLCYLKNERSIIRRNSFNYIKAFINYHFLNKKNAFDLLTFNNIFEAVNKNTIALSIGGDNYCYGEANYIYMINEEVKKRGAKTVLWGCSVDENLLTPKMIADLKSYDLIVARESITYESMKKINEKTILYPDPAFQLKSICLPLPDNFVENNTIGINVSPMIIDNELNNGITLKNYEKLIEYILNKTDMNIALIPHVIWNFNDDRKPIKYLYDKYKYTNRLVSIEGYSAEKLKGFISRCRFFVGARTHSTIAAYSTCVPTLVVGYSVKAKGIAKDIFGTYENYVVPVQSLCKEDDLVHAFQWIYKNESLIRNHLEQFIPKYCDKTLELKEVIKEL